MPAYRYLVRGRVQGVGYRYFVLRQADAFGVTGFARNRADGSVEVVAEGHRDDIEALLEALHSGPPGALVSRVEIRPELPLGRMTSFDIRSAAHRGD